MALFKYPTNNLSGSWLRHLAAVCGVAMATWAPSAASAAHFDAGVTLRVGFTTLTAPPDLDAAAALLGAANNRTLSDISFGGFDFAIGTNSFNLSGTTISASCLASAQFCSAFNDPADPSFFGLIISDTAVGGGALDSIINVTSLIGAPVYFNSNTIILDLSGLLLSSYPNITQLAQVEFGSSSAVPVPAALPLFASGLGLLGFAGWRRRRKTER